MRHLLNVVKVIVGAVVAFIVLIHDGESDIRGTYPDQYVPTGEQVATQGSVTFNLLGQAH